MQVVEMELLMSDFPVVFQVMCASSVLSVKLPEGDFSSFLKVLGGSV